MPRPLCSGPHLREFAIPTGPVGMCWHGGQGVPVPAGVRVPRARQPRAGRLEGRHRAGPGKRGGDSGLGGSDWGLLEGEGQGGVQPVAPSSRGQGQGTVPRRLQSSGLSSSGLSSPGPGQEVGPHSGSSWFPGQRWGRESAAGPGTGRGGQGPGRMGRKGLATHLFLPPVSRGAHGWRETEAEGSDSA